MAILASQVDMECFVLFFLITPITWRSRNINMITNAETMPTETHFIFKKIYTSWSTLGHGNIRTNLRTDTNQKLYFQ